jgi:flagellin-like protein
MKRDPVADPRQRSTAPDERGWPHLSDRARDAGDRAICGVLGAAVVVAVALAVAWFYAMPSFR